MEEAAILISALEDSDLIENFARLIDIPEQMEDVCALAREAVELQTASVKDVNAITELKLLKDLERNKRRDSVGRFIRKYASKEVPLHKNPVECLALIEKHIGNSILDALFELSRIDLGEGVDEAALKKAIKAFDEVVDQVYSSDVTLRSKERDAYIIASMLLWKRSKNINKIDGVDLNAESP